MDKLLKEIKLKGWMVYIPIALLFNSFAHKLALTMNSKYDFNVNKRNSIQFLFILGIVVLILDRMIKDNSIKVNINEDIIKGFRIGAILILISACVNSWGDMGDSFQTLMIGIALVAIVYYCKNR